MTIDKKQVELRIVDEISGPPREMQTSIDHAPFHEVWWIYSAEKNEWGGLRTAHFKKTPKGELIVFITTERDPRRVGLWDDIAAREGWIKIKQIPFPSHTDIIVALTAAIDEILRRS
jgi:hypothetical protein